MNVNNIITDLARPGLLRQGASNLFIKIGGTFIALIFNVILAKKLGAFEFGVFSFTMSLVTFFAILSQIGLPTVLARFYAELTFAKDFTMLKGLTKFSFAAAFILSITFSMIFLVLYLSWFDSTEYKSSIFYAAFLLPIISLSSLRRGAMIGLGKSSIGQIPEEIFRPLIFLCGLLFFSLSQNQQIDSSAMALRLLLISAFVSMLIGFISFKKYLPAEIGQLKSNYQTRIWILAAMPLLITAVCEFILNQIEILLIGKLSGYSDVGVFRVAQAGASITSFVLVAGNMALAPVFAQRYKDRDIVGLVKIAVNSSRIMAALTGVIAIIIIANSKLILCVFFGDEYVRGATVLIVLSLGHLINVSMGSVATILNMSGYQKITLFGFIVGCVVSIILNLILIPLIGNTGAAAGSISGMITWNIILTLYLKKIGINCSIFGSKSVTPSHSI
jgi:O-antigen/teichoic acid export membrane protein